MTQDIRGQPPCIAWWSTAAWLPVRFGDSTTAQPHYIAFHAPNFVDRLPVRFGDSTTAQPHYIAFHAPNFVDRLPVRFGDSTTAQPHTLHSMLRTLWIEDHVCVIMLLMQRSWSAASTWEDCPLRLRYTGVSSLVGDSHADSADRGAVRGRGKGCPGSWRR